VCGEGGVGGGFNPGWTDITSRAETLMAEAGRFKAGENKN